MKKILISLSIIGIAAGVVIGGTIAFFNDTETSTGNILTAGSIDLKVDSFGSEYNNGDVLFPQWAARDLDEEKFFFFDDIKPGDFGWRNLSLHVEDNPAWACLLIHDKKDDENVVVDPEFDAGDTADDGVPFGELSQELELFAWEDLLPDGIYDPARETALMTAPDSFFDVDSISYSDSTNGISPLSGFGDTRFITIAWCAGTLTVNVDGNLIQPGLPGSTIECDGAGMGDIVQTDIFDASMTAYAEQVRNNPDFKCSDVTL